MIAATPAPRDRAALAWWSFLVVAGAMAGLALLQWIDALVTGRPVLYGEGPVANAALLLRQGDAYRDVAPERFVAANYPPLYLWLAGAGDPFRAGRGLTMICAIAVAAMVAWRARGAGRLAAAALAAGWLAIAPVAIWGAAVKPDLLAVALTAGAVALLDARRSAVARALLDARRSAAAGALLAAAAWAKPTALLPAAALLAWLLLRDRARAGHAALGAVAGVGVGVVAVAASGIGVADVWRHVIVWNALSWDAEQAVLVIVLGVATFGISTATAVLYGGARGAIVAYGIGALAVAVLGGREGATINYLLDLAAATALGLAAVAPRLRASSGYPIAAIVQLAIAVALLGPFGIVPGREPGTGAWGARERTALVRDLPVGPAYLVEDSGLLVATGHRPVVDDLFLWSRLAHAGLVDPAPILERVRDGGFAAIVSEADLERLGSAPAYERARWHPDLVAAVLGRYTLERATGVLWLYRPR